VHNHAAAGDIERPVIGDACASVKFSFDGEIEVESGVAHFDEQPEILRLRIRCPEVKERPYGHR
jgi:hypothetical protein